MHPSFGYSLVGPRSFCTGRIKFAADATGTGGGRQTFRVRPFPTACIMHAAAGCFDDADDDNDDDEGTTSLLRSPLCTYFSDRPDGILVRGSPPTFSLERNHTIPLFVVARPSTVSFHGRLVNTLSPEASTSKRLLGAAYGIQIARMQLQWNGFNPFLPPIR